MEIYLFSIASELKYYRRKFQIVVVIKVHLKDVQEKHQLNSVNRLVL